MKNRKLNNQITKNKKAYFDYEIISSYEAWLELKWYEVKSIRNKHVNLKWSFVVIINWELYIKWMHISAWKTLSNKQGIETDRERKVFIHKKDIIYLSWKIKESWFSLIPLELYLVWSLIKLKIALAKGKKSYQKKQILKERTMDKEARMATKKYI